MVTVLWHVYYNENVSQRERLLEARRARKMTQHQVAAAIGCPQSTIGRLETNRHEPSLRIALAIARTLGTTVEYLFGGDEPAPDHQPAPPKEEEAVEREPLPEGVVQSVAAQWREKRKERRQPKEGKDE